MKVNDIDMDAVILGNDEYPTHSMPKTMLIAVPYVVCCDGSADEHIRQGFILNAIIGDGDSLSMKNKDCFREVFHQIDDQETSDQTKATHFPLDQGKKVIILVSTTGKREDHTLGSISLLVDYMKVEVQMTMLTDRGVFVPVPGRSTFESHLGQQIFVFNFGTAGPRGEELVYPFSDFDSWWQGTLNEATGGEFTVHAEGNYLVYLSY